MHTDHKTRLPRRGAAPGLALSQRRRHLPSGGRGQAPAAPALSGECRSQASAAANSSDLATLRKIPIVFEEEYNRRERLASLELKHRGLSGAARRWLARNYDPKNPRTPSEQALAEMPATWRGRIRQRIRKALRRLVDQDWEGERLNRRR